MYQTTLNELSGADASIYFFDAKFVLPTRLKLKVLLEKESYFEININE